MITRLLMLFSFAAFIGFAPSIAYATEPLFRNCSSVLETKEFQRLKAYYAKSKEDAAPSYCFKLNRDEFLVTVEDTGRVSQGLYYYDASNDSYGLVDGRYCPSIAIKQEFTGAHKKRYALIECSNLQHGNWDTSYLILYLAPGKKRQSFIFKKLLFVNEDPESGFCGSRIHDAATSIKGFHISGEGGEQVRLEVSIEKENCKTGLHKKYVRLFQPHNGDFVEVNAGANEN